MDLQQLKDRVKELEFQLKLAKAERDSLKADKEELKRMLNSYVLLVRFSPVEKIVYGMVGIILTTVLTSMLFIIIRAG